MLEMYHLPLPTHSELFAEALRSPDTVDESDLARWKNEPPFEEDEDSSDPDSAAYLRFTNSLVDVLHGVRLREQNRRDAELREEIQSNGREHLFRRLQQDVLKKRAAWCRVEEIERTGIYHPSHQPREFAMLKHYIQWLGRSICHLYYLYSTSD
ncbi:hypothetical protein R3P38DRAFT_3225835 [Favolaschia claudopus]|uniref:Uncharacterized protein n=1 Tax=Favolaschia claudopus TaxID=2862362 RepID=A0AAV9ZUL1_9AGAR